MAQGMVQRMNVSLSREDDKSLYNKVIEQGWKPIDIARAGMIKLNNTSLNAEKNKDLFKPRKLK